MHPERFEPFFSESLSREDVASSNKRIGAFLIIALAIAILCFCPPDILTPDSPATVS